jgi:hypothetical protein
MAEPESTRTDGAVNPDTFVADLLDFAEASLRVAARHDIGAVEVPARAHGLPPTTILVCPEQALALAAVLISTATAVIEARRAAP